MPAGLKICKNLCSGSFFCNSRSEAVVAASRFVSTGSFFTEIYTLFIHGKDGSGKTHLLDNLLHETLGAGKTCYATSAEGFCEDMVNAVVENSLSHFRQSLISQDLVIVDDVHFLSGKEKSQEEMTFLVRDRVERKKPTIFTANTHYKSLKDFDECLYSRLGAGLVMEIA